MEEELINIHEVEADYYTVLEVAAIFNVTRRTIYRWVNRGLLRRCRFGKRAMIPKSDVNHLVENYQKIQAPKAACK